MTAREFLSHLRGVQRTGAGWVAFCPAHEDRHKRSLSVAEREDKILLKCFTGCPADAIVTALGLRLADLFASPNGDEQLSTRRIAATYDYEDEHGTLLYQVVRFDPKDFRPRHPDDTGEWHWGLGDVRRVLYRLPHLVEREQVFLVEGEKDVDRLVSLGLAATTVPGGANGWRVDYADQLRALAVREVVILPDHDEPGEHYARAAARSLCAMGVRVKILRLPGLADRGDVSAWLDGGGTREELLRLADAAPEWAADDEPLPLPLAASLGIGLGTFLERDFPEPEPLVEGLLAADGGGWIGGEAKLGKTLFALEEGVCLALALPVCGRFTVPVRRRVLFVEEEDSPRRTHLRARALLRGHGLDPDDPALRTDLDAWFRIASWEGFSFDRPEMVARLEATLAEFRPAVCYLDPLRKLSGRDLNKAPEASAMLAVLDDLRRRYGTLFRVIHHYRKPQGFRVGRGSQEISGSFVLGAWGESSLFFEPIGRKAGAIRVEPESKDGAPQPGFRLKIEAEGPRHAPTLLRLLAEDDADPNEADELVCQAVATLPKQDALTGEPGVSVEALAAATKRSKETVRRSLKRLLTAERCLVTGTMTKGAKLYGVNGE